MAKPGLTASAGWETLTSALAAQTLELPLIPSSFPPRLPRPRLGLGPHLRSFREWIPPHLPRHISGQGRALRPPKFLLPSLLF